MCGARCYPVFIVLIGVLVFSLLRPVLSGERGLRRDVCKRFVILLSALHWNTPSEYTRAMSTPPPSVTPSRLNVGGYGVGVRAAINIRGAGQMRPTFPKWVQTHAGTVTPDGSLSIEPEPWATRHYRRAVMRGAGVYQAGLWAMLAGRAKVVEPEQGAGLGGNDGRRVLDRFTPFERPTPESVATGERWLAYTFSGTPKTYRRRQARRVTVEGAPYGLRMNTLPPARIRTRYTLAAVKITGREFWASGQALHRFRTEGKRLRALLSRGAHSRRYLAALAPLLAQIIKRGDLYRAHLARLVKPQRAPRRAPRPIYSRAIPPAAPLAPPAL